MFKNLDYDLQRVLDEDPAAKSKIEVLLLYPCIHALISIISDEFIPYIELHIFFTSINDFL